MTRNAASPLSAPGRTPGVAPGSHEGEARAAAVAGPPILCVGSVLWDIIGRAPFHMRAGSDVPGRISRLPGGVAMNIAMTAVHFGLRPILLTVIGRDPEGEELAAACTALGLDMRHVYRSDDLPTDRYMAIEGANGVIAAIADAHSLEAAGARILRPIVEGPLGSSDRPWPGLVALDGNLTTTLLHELATSPALAAARLSVAPASPGKAERLMPFIQHHRGTLYLNLEEAGILAGRQFGAAREAAEALVARGAARVIVTAGADEACDGSPEGLVTGAPPRVLATRVTGAGDTFMAAHIAAEARGVGRPEALETALRAAARYVSGETPL